MAVCRNKITCLKDVEHALRPLDNLITENMNPLLFLRLHEGLVILVKAAKNQELTRFELITSWFELYVKTHKLVYPRKRSMCVPFLKILAMGVHLILKFLQLRPKSEDAYTLLKMIESVIINVSAGCVLELLAIKNLMLYFWKIIANAGDFNTQMLVLRLMTMLMKCCDEEQRNMHLARISGSKINVLPAEIQKAIRCATDRVDQFGVISRSILNSYNKECAMMVYSFNCTSIKLGKYLTFNKSIHKNEFWVDLNFCPRTLTFQGRCDLTCNQIIDVSLAVSKIVFDGNMMTVHYKRPAVLSKPLSDLEYLRYIGHADLLLPDDELARLIQRVDMISYFNGENDTFLENLRTNQDIFYDDGSSDLDNIELDEAFILGTRDPQRNETALEANLGTDHSKQDCLDLPEATPKTRNPNNSKISLEHSLNDISKGISSGKLLKTKRKYPRRTVQSKPPSTASSTDAEISAEWMTEEVNILLDPCTPPRVAESSATIKEKVQPPKAKRKYTRRPGQSKTSSTASTTDAEFSAEYPYTRPPVAESSATIKENVRMPKPKRKYTRRSVQSKTLTTACKVLIDPLTLPAVAENNAQTIKKNVQIPKPKRKHTPRTFQSKRTTPDSPDDYKMNQRNWVCRKYYTRSAKADTSTGATPNGVRMDLPTSDHSVVKFSTNEVDNGGTAASTLNLTCNTYRLNEIGEGHFEIIECNGDQSETNNLCENMERPFESSSTLNENNFCTSPKRSEAKRCDTPTRLSFRELIRCIFDDDDSIRECRNSVSGAQQSIVLKSPQIGDLSVAHNLPLQIPDDSTILPHVDMEFQSLVCNSTQETSSKDGISSSSSLNCNKEMDFSFDGDLNQQSLRGTNESTPNSLEETKCHIEECMVRFSTKLPIESQRAYERQVAATCEQLFAEYQRERKEMHEMENHIERIEQELYKFCQSYDRKMKTTIGVKEKFEDQLRYLKSLRVAHNTERYYDDLREELLNTMK